MSAERVLQSILQLDVPNSEVCVCLGSMLGNDNLPTLEMLNMTTELTDEFKSIITRLFERVSEEQARGDLLLREYDAGYKSETHEIEWTECAEVEEIVDSLACIPDPVVNTPMFEANDDFIDGLHFYVIIVQPPEGSRALFFRKYDRKKELSRSKSFGAFFADGHYDKIQETAFIFDNEIDCIARGDFIFSRRKHYFQQIFGFFAKLREKACECLNAIRDRVPIVGFDEFSASCQSHLYKLAKLNNIATKPYLQTVTMKDLKKTIRKFNLDVRVVRENGVEKLQYDAEDRWVILKLLDDDYLGSVMTKLQYEVNSKRQV